MAWETRHNKRFYYRSVRKGDRVVKEYLGDGACAEAQANLDAARRMACRNACEQWQTEQHRIDARDAQVEQFDQTVDLLARLVLVGAGFHQHHRGEWRKRRGVGNGTDGA